tara:strand:+ start:248 stop:373 length:126 start_codon:yes stop_codon:yes gene_type:complete
MDLIGDISSILEHHEKMRLQQIAAAKRENALRRRKRMKLER